jgi:hypothetical protein
MTRFITHAVFNGTALKLAVPGKDIDAVMLRLRRKKELRAASVFMFYSRKTDKLIEVRGN